MAVFLVAHGLCGPWGNYPLNDDWQYARTAKAFAETGRVLVDTPVAPSLWGQALLAAPVIKLFGFSHTALRLLTIALGAVGLWAIDRLLRFASCPTGVRLFPLLVVALNPLYFYLSATFMTEVYGYVQVLLAAALWFHGRSKSAPGGPAVGLGVALLVGALMGAAFWTRQNCAVWFGALLAASALRLVLDRDWARFRRSLLPLASGLTVFALVVGLYFAWARWTGNLRPEFSRPLGTMTSSVDAHAWTVQSIVYLAYMSVFLAPLLLLVRPRGRRRAAVGWAAALILASYLGSEHVASQGGPEVAMAAWLRRFFPYLHNVFFNAGIGPVTFAEMTGADFPIWPHWPRAAFLGLHAYSVLAAGLWSLVFIRLGALFRSQRRCAVEVFLFGACAAALSFAATIQAYPMRILDRYHLPGVLGGALAVGALLGFDARSGEATRRRWARPLAFGAPWLALSLFTVAGLHDYLRWNDARWQLVNDHLAQGHSPLKLQGGYEVNGWLNFDAYTRGQRPPEGSGPCCYCFQPSWYCVDDTYWVGMAAPPGRVYEVVRSLRPGYWLAPGPPVTLYRRP